MILIMILLQMFDDKIGKAQHGNNDHDNPNNTHQPIIC